MKMDNSNPKKTKRRTFTAVLDLKNVEIIEKNDAPVYKTSILRWLKTVSSTFKDVDFDGPLLPLFIS